MTHMQRWGGVAGMVAAATYIVGFALFLTVLDNKGDGSKVVDALESVAFIADHRAVLYATNVTIYVVNAFALVVLSLALNQRLQSASPGLAQTATAFGLIWSTLLLASGMIANVGMQAVIELHATDPAQSALLWRSLSTIEEAVGGGNELAGGMWILLASCAALRGRELPRALACLGVAIGASGLLTVIPSFEVLGAIFGLGFIVWFAWIGAFLWRESRAQMA